MLHYLRMIAFGSGFLLTATLLIGQTAKNCYRADPGSGARSHKLDYKQMELDVSFKPNKGIVNGEVKHKFQPLRQDIDSFFLDGPGITFKSVELGQKSTAHQVTDTGIWIYPEQTMALNTTYQLAITYSAKPRKGIYFIGWNGEKPENRKQIWTQGQGIDNRHWIPCYDNPNDKLITEVKVTFQEDYQVLSNGKRIDLTTNPETNTKTWHYKMQKPHSPYLVMLAIGRYDVDKRVTSNGVPLYFYSYPEEPEKVQPTYEHSKAIMDFFEDETGIDYPWSRYSQVPVQDFLYGAMENTTATIFGDFYYGNKKQQLDQDYTYVNAHELAHHWFGNYITINSDEHIWLHESFATHYGRLAERHLYGEQHYQEIREQQLQRAISAADKNTRPIMHTEAGVNRVYPKGALVLGMLKDVVGKQAYDRVVRYYLKEHAYDNVTTHDFEMAFQEVLGMNLNWFFDQWIRRGGMPHYKISYQVIDKPNPRVTVEVKQIHQTNDLVGFYSMPIPIEVHYEDGTMDQKKPFVKGKTSKITFSKPSDKSVKYVLFDPGNQVLKQETFQQPIEVLTQKATDAPKMIDRYDALKKLRDKPNDIKLNALKTIYRKANHKLLQKEALQQLSAYPSSKVVQLLRKGLMADNHEVRRVVLKSLDSIPAPLIPLFEQSLQDSSYQNVKLALEKLIQQQPQNLNTYFTTIKGVKGLDNHNVRIAWLELATVHKSQSYLKKLVPYAGPGYEFRTRVKAMKALKRLNHCNEKVIRYLVDAYLNPNGRLSGPAKEVLAYFYEQHQYREVIKSYYQQKEWAEFAKAKWRSLLN